MVPVTFFLIKKQAHVHRPTHACT